MSWDEYAALTRHFGAVRRSAADQQSAGRTQRAAAQERATRLDARLAAQRERLRELAAQIGASQRDLLAPVPPALDAAPRPPLTAEAHTGAPAAVDAAPEPPAITTSPHPAPPAVAPPQPGQRTAHVPAQRTGPPDMPAVPAPAPPPSPPVAGDPWAALDAADRHADAADAAAADAEAASVRPPLLPGATPLTRSLVVYGAGAAIAMAVQIGLIMLSDARGFTFSIAAWACTGLPAMAFFAGFGALTVWGRPAIDDGRPVDRNPRLGFAICFLAMPVATCGYLALVQLVGG